MALRLALLVLVTLLIKMSTCQWSLVIQLFEYHNPFNAERIDSNTEQYCCCDVDICSAVLNRILFSTCPQECDVFFNVNISHCEPLERCSISTIDYTIHDSPPDSTYGYIFTFDLENVTENMSFLLEMRDRSGTLGVLSDPIDRLDVTVATNDTSYNRPTELIGNEGIVTFLISHQLVCTNLSVCDPTLTQTEGSSVVASNQIETVTVERIFTRTVVITETPTSPLPGQSSETDSEVSSTAWIVVSIIFLTVAIISVTTSIILGLMVYRNSKGYKVTGVKTTSASTEDIISNKESGPDNALYAQPLDQNGSVIVKNGHASPPEVYVRLDNELYSGSGQSNNQDKVTSASRENIYNEPSEPKNDKPATYEFDSPLYASTKETDL